MEMTSEWFIRICSNSQTLPTDFPFEFFSQAISILVDLDHGSSTAKVCWLLYQIFHILPQLEREKLLLKLLEPQKFYSLFFHWSWNVRLCFHYFYYFQLNRLLIESNQKMSDSIRISMQNIECNVDEVLNTFQETKTVKRTINMFGIVRNPNLPREINDTLLAQKNF